MLRAAFLVLVSAAPVAAEARQRGPAVWLDAPTQAEAAAARPVGLSGFGIIICRARDDGGVHRCRLTGGTPEQQALSRATLSLSHRFRLARTGRPGRQVQVPLWFRKETAYVDQVIWRDGPRGEDLNALLRPLVRGAPAVASATLDCRIGVQGRLEDCRAARASTPEVGAALAGWASRLTVSALTGQGAPVIGGRVRLPISYSAE